MRYGIFSDIHANLEALEAVIEAYKQERIDRYFCVGDIVGYGANPCECIEQVKRIVSGAVAGNHDWGSVGLLALNYFNPLALEAILWTKQQLDKNSINILNSLKLFYQDNGVTFVHSGLNNPQEFNYMLDKKAALESFKLLETNICFVGHTHIAGIFSEDKSGNIVYLNKATCAMEEGFSYIVNTGSVGQPRDGNPQAAFCIYDSVSKTIEIKRTAYDIKKARAKIIAAGLPQYLGDRLLNGG